MSLLTLTTALGLIATFVTLVWGFGSITVDGSHDKKYSERLIFVRIAIQIFAFVMLLIAVYLTATS